MVQGKERPLGIEVTECFDVKRVDLTRCVVERVVLRGMFRAKEGKKAEAAMGAPALVRPHHESEGKASPCYDF